MPYSPIGERASPLRSLTFNVDPVKHMRECHRCTPWDVHARASHEARVWAGHLRVCNVTSNESWDTIGVPPILGGCDYHHDRGNALLGQASAWLPIYDQASTSYTCGHISIFVQRANHTSMGITPRLRTQTACLSSGMVSSTGRSFLYLHHTYRVI